MSAEYLDVLRLTPDDITRLLGEVNRSAPPGGDATERRTEPRCPYRGHSIVLIEISEPSRDTGAFRAISFNISEHGLGFLHGKFVYPGSECRVLLWGSAGELIGVRGEAVRCRLVEGRVHEVGLRFSERLDLSRVQLDMRPNAGEIEEGADSEGARAGADAGADPGPEPGVVAGAHVDADAEDGGVGTSARAGGVDPARSAD